LFDTGITLTLTTRLVQLLNFCAFLHHANKMEKQYFCVSPGSHEDKIVKCFWGVLFWKMLLRQES